MSAVRMLMPSGQVEEVESVPATRVKNAFAEVLDKVAARGIVAITRHDKARVMMLSVPEFESLVQRAGDPLERLRGQFDDLVAKMQGPATGNAVDELFGPDLASRKPAARRMARR